MMFIEYTLHRFLNVENRKMSDSEQIYKVLKETNMLRGISCYC